MTPFLAGVLTVLAFANLIVGIAILGTAARIAREIVDVARLNSITIKHHVATVLKEVHSSELN